MTYVGRVHQTAINMARYKHQGKPYNHSEFIKVWIPAAWFTVAAQAESVRDALTHFCFHKSDIDRHLLEHGYIEPKAGFHCNNKGRHYSDPGYKRVCEKQCATCAEQYPVNGG